MAKITYATKSTGDTFTAANANEIKTAVNGGTVTPSTVITATVASVTSAIHQTGDIIKTTIVIDIVGAKSVATDLDIIGDTGVCYIAQVTDAINGSIFAGQMGCAVVPSVGADDIDLYSSSDNDGAYDADASALTDAKALVTSGGAHAIGTVKPFTVLPAADDYLYLASGEAVAGTYDAGTLIIEMWGTAA